MTLEEPKPEQIIVYAKTQRGRAMLIYQGYKYVKNRHSSTNLFWRCARYVKHGCRATLVTSRDSDPPTIRLSETKHSHPREVKN